MTITIQPKGATWRDRMEQRQEIVVVNETAEAWLGLPVNPNVRRPLVYLKFMWEQV